jgi:hypothetical protein
MLKHSRRLIASLVVSLLPIVLPSEAAAQAGAPAEVSLDTGPSASARVALPRLRLDRLSGRLGELKGRAQPAPGGRPRDSLTNGLIIGALVGAAALGGFGGAICKAQQEPGGPSCVSDTLRIAAVGAAIGAGAGLAVDAARTQHAGARVSIRLRF